MTGTESIISEIYDAWRAQDLEWLASYLPDDFCHLTNIPPEVHPLGGIRRGKAASMERLAIIADDFEVLRFDTSGLIVADDKAGVEISIRYRHRETGTSLDTTVGNFWIFEDGWPVKLTEYHDIGSIHAFSKRLAGIIPGAPPPPTMLGGGQGRPASRVAAQ